MIDVSAPTKNSTAHRTPRGMRGMASQALCNRCPSQPQGTTVELAHMGVSWSNSAWIKLLKLSKVKAPS
jgi:hypothetical protein